MVFLAGVDEAGYGPLLGPLAVGYSLFRVPDAETELWRVLGGCVTRGSGRDTRRLRVDDSKKVHSGPRGRERLQRSVAAFRRLVAGEDDTLRSWLSEPPAGNARWLQAVPWFHELHGPLCPDATVDRAHLDAACVRRGLEAAGCCAVGFGARAVPAAEWNHLLARLHGKGAALFAVTMEVLRHLLAASGDAPLRVELDRHGGRTRYRDLLHAALQPDRIEVHAEAPAASLYSLYFGARRIELRFSEDADARLFPVALASLAAKQTRESLMDRWNAWFCGRLPAVRPTRGYAQDARRWLGEVAPHLGPLGVEWQALRRLR